MIGIALMGCGVVGRGVVEVLRRNAARLKCAAGDALALKKVLDIRKPQSLPEGALHVIDIREVVEDPQISVVVECMGGLTPAHDYVTRALASGKHVVTSNKHLVATHGKALIALARENHVHFMFEASVGGGIPILRAINECLTADEIQSVTGILNGTTNYILSRMSGAKVDFPAALGEAQREGYAEADPSADIEGIDARRKLAILAHLSMGASLGGDALIPTRGIMHVEQQDALCASALGRSVKLIAHARRVPGGWSGWVAPCALAEDHPLYAVRGVYNGILIEGNMVGDVLFQGQGAGSLPTASAVCSDIVGAARTPVRTRHDPREHVPFVSPEADEVRYLVRVVSTDTALDERRVLDALPGARIVRLSGEAAQSFGVLTEAMPAGACTAKFDALRAVGVKLCEPLRYL